MLFEPYANRIINQNAKVSFWLRVNNCYELECECDCECEAEHEFMRCFSIMFGEIAKEMLEE